MSASARTVCRHLWKQLRLAFPRKSKLPLAERRLSCQHYFNDSLRSCHACSQVFVKAWKRLPRHLLLEFT